MILKISPTKDLGAEVLSVDTETGTIYVQVDDSDPHALAVGITAIPGNTMEEMARNKAKSGRYLSVNASGDIRLGQSWGKE